MDDCRAVAGEPKGLAPAFHAPYDNAAAPGSGRNETAIRAEGCMPDRTATWIKRLDLAAACGTPSIVLFGPTDPRLWGPLPRAGLDAPYEAVAAAQRRGNVMLLQQPSLACVPCQREGCERHRLSFSACLDALSAASVIDAARTLLEPARAAGASPHA